MHSSSAKPWVLLSICSIQPEAVSICNGAVALDLGQFPHAGSLLMSSPSSSNLVGVCPFPASPAFVTLYSLRLKCSHLAFDACSGKGRSSSALTPVHSLILMFSSPRKRDHRKRDHRKRQTSQASATDGISQAETEQPRLKVLPSVLAISRREVLCLLAPKPIHDPQTVEAHITWGVSVTPEPA